MNKNFDKWNKIKKETDNIKNIIKFQERHILFMKIGVNVGYEQDGKGEEFLRPVLVYKKFNKRIFLGIPLTSKEKLDKFHFQFEYKKGVKSFAILSQIKLFDVKRAKYYHGKISKDYFNKLQQKLLDLIVTPLHQEGECTKAICSNIISQKNLNVKKNILVTGANGQLGSEIRYLVMNDELGIMNEKSVIQNYNFYFTDRNKLDITNKKELKEFIDKNNIKIIINCAAYTAVDKAEEEKELANLINFEAVKYLSEISKKYNIFLIHISTDYIFDGKSYIPYKEDDKPNPQSVYGLTKLKGEEAFINSKAKGIIIRTSWVYSSFGNNFVKTMLKLAKEKEELGVIFDQIGTPTYARDLAKIILKIIDKNHEKLNNFKAEIFHFSNEGVCSWYDFAKAIFEINNIDIKVNPLQSKEYKTLAQRPYYSVLNKSKIKNEFNINIPYWKDSLRECITKIMSDEF